MDPANLLLGLAGLVVVVSVVIGIGIIGWRLIVYTMNLLRQPRPSVFSLLYYAGVLILLILVISVFVPLMAGAIYQAVTDSREDVMGTAYELNSWIIEAVEGVSDGTFGTFSNSRLTPQQQQNQPAPPSFNPNAQGELLPTDPDMGGGHGVPPDGWVVPVPQEQPLPTPHTIEVIPPPTLAPRPTATRRPPTPVPTFDAGTWNQLTPAPTPEIVK